MAKPQRIGLVFEHDMAYPRGVLRGIKQFAQTKPNWILVMLEPEALSAQALEVMRPSGVIANAFDKRIIELLAAQHRPVVNCSPVLRDVPFASVMVDHREVGRLASEHLVDRGLRHFGVVGHPRHLYSVEREAGFREALAGTDATCESFYERPAVSFRRRARLLALSPSLQEWLRRLPKPVGIFTCHDIWGLQVVEACRLAKLAVPEQVAVIGVDNDDLLCELARPSLSSIIVPAQRIGFQSATMLARLLKGHTIRRSPLLVTPPGVIARQSSDILSGGDAELTAAVRYIRDHPHLPLTVSDVLNVVPISRRALEQRFQRLLKRGIGEEIRRIHLARAKRLLGTTVLPIAEIAQQSGYRSVHYLSRAFRKETGQTPSQFRANYYGQPMT
jgi:LacI family transcriptional regulator